MIKSVKTVSMLCLFLLAGCSSSAAVEQDINTSLPVHHQANGRFENPPGSPQGTATFIDMVRFFSGQIFNAPDPVIPPEHVIAKREQRRQMARAGNPSLTWLGHAAFIIRIGEKVIITDPYLDKVAGPWGVGPSRFVGSPLTAEELPKADVMLISHNHYDHLDAKTVEAYPWKDHTQVIVPLGLGDFFRKRGYGNVLEQDWWDSWSLDGLTVTALPAVHFSGRGIADRNKTLWASFSIDSGDQKIWFSGDTARGKIFREIGERAGPFDYALVAIGAYMPRKVMQNVHVTPEEAIEISRTIGANRAIGMHWGTIMLTPEDPFDAPVRFRQAAKEQGFGVENAWIMKIGETVPL